jgi:hypothetical protein
LLAKARSEAMKITPLPYPTITGIHRDTIMRLGACVGRGCAELHDRMMNGLRVGRIETDELWAYVGKKQKQVTRKDGAVFDDQYTFIAMASSAKAIIAYHTGKRDSDNCDRFIQDLRSRVLGAPEISTDGFLRSGMPSATAWRTAS